MPPVVDPRPLLARLREQRGNPVLLCSSTLAADLVPPLYQGLRSMGGAERLDLVLSTYGGSVASTRQIALLIREFADRLSILVPQRARSAGTLLCLSADELVLSPFAELGPLDANMDATEAPAAGTPGFLSAEDIRAFPEMARDWFGVNRPEDGLQLLAMLSQRIFPASLSSFYRLDKLVRQVAGELLAYGLPDPTDEPKRSRIVEQLVTGYHAHDYVLTRADARRLGLPVVDPDPAEERLLWELAERLSRPYLGAGQASATGPATSDLPGPAESAAEPAGMVASVDFLACNVVRHGSGQPDWQIED